MASPALLPSAATPPPGLLAGGAMGQLDTPEEVTVDNPLTAEQQEAADKAEEEEREALRQIRTRYKGSWAPKRQGIIRRILKAFEYAKNNPYNVMNLGTGEMDNLTSVLSGNTQADDQKLYQYNDNVYQMLLLSFMAALGPDIAKLRWMPDDPGQEPDLAFAKKASTMMAYIERMNNLQGLQMLKLLYLFCCGTYFVYVRNTVDSVRAGTTKNPILEMRDQEVAPARFLCSGCGATTPAAQLAFQDPSCSGCQAPLGQKDWYPPESMPMPVQVGVNEQANAMTAIDIFCALQVDLDPVCEALAKTPLLDLEAEMDFAAVRACYPGSYNKLTGGAFGEETGSSNDSRMARERVSSPAGVKGSLLTSESQVGTFSRCWIQPFAFNSVEDQELAKRLQKKYPKGVKLVQYGDVVLETREESLLEHWEEGRTIKGFGMNPWGVGDVALSVQDRVDDTANNIHIYQDRMALPPVLANAMLIDAQALGRQRLGGGRILPVFPALKGNGIRFGMQDALWQPTFHADSQIYTYSATLMTLMQLLTGIQPQIFGGGTQRGVDTASGQEQQLNTAMGRLMLFVTATRAEAARTAKLAVKLMASDIDDQKRITVDGAAKDQYDSIYVLQSDVQGDLHAFPDSDQGFPASYGEMRERIMQLLGMIKDNPVLQTMLDDPDTQKVLSLYVLPDGVKLPGDSMRIKAKMTIDRLANDPTGPLTVDDGQGGQVILPSLQPDPEVDDMGVIEAEAKEWAQKNYESASTNPTGYSNVRAYLRLAVQLGMQKAAKMAATQAALGSGAPDGAAPPAQ